MWVDGESHLDLALMETLICLDLGDHQDLDHFDGDMNIVGLGRSPGLGYTDEETNLLGLHRSSQFDSFNEQNFNMQSLRFTVMECREDLVPVDPSA